MRFEDEIYVRVYTRDTPDLLALGWEGRALLWEILRKVDRAGLLPIGKSGHRGLAALLHMPEDVVGRALPALLEDGVVVLTDGVLCVRNFIEAQETPQSNAAKCRDYRARKRDIARARALGVHVPLVDDDDGATELDTERHAATPRDQARPRLDTERHAATEADTSRPEHRAFVSRPTRNVSPPTPNDPRSTPGDRNRHLHDTSRHSLLSFAKLREGEAEARVPAHAHAYTREAEPTSPPPPPPARPTLMSEAGESLHRALQASRSFRSLSGRVAQELAAQVDSGRIDLADALHVVAEADEREAIRQVAEQDTPTPGGLAKYLGGWMRRAQRGDAKRAAAPGSWPRADSRPQPGQPVPMAPYEVPPDVAAALAVPEEVYARRHREQRATEAARADTLRAARAAKAGQARPTTVGGAARLDAALLALQGAFGAASGLQTADGASGAQSALQAPTAAQESASASADSEHAS